MSINTRKKYNKNQQELMEDLETKFQKLTSNQSKLMFVTLNLKKEGKLTQDQHLELKSTRNLQDRFLVS